MKTQFMRAAIEQAELAKAAGEVPVGAVVVRDGQIIARGHNMCERTSDPTAHAEIVALRAAADITGDFRLNDCTLYVTLEPCPMCAGAALMARVGSVIFGAYDPVHGCCGSVYRLTEDPAFTHFAPADGGVLEAECACLLKGFARSTNACHG